jgi:4-hydroxybenzoate polyprenyltransferase
LIALRLGAGMLALQCSIGALNDVVDAPLDARQKPRKPIPSGHVGRRGAAAVVGVGALLGILLSALSGPATAAVAAIGLALGYAYDLRLSRTVLSWLPLALALPLLPIHAWLGATNGVPDGLLALIPTAALAGAGLALANGLVDVDRDAAAGRRTIAVAVGRRRSWTLQTAALATAAALAVIAAPVVSGAIGDPDTGLALLRALRVGGIVLGILGLSLGSIALAASDAGTRERGWELEAVGVAALGVGWLAGTAAVAGSGAGA